MCISAARTGRAARCSRATGTGTACRTWRLVEMRDFHDSWTVRMTRMRAFQMLRRFATGSTTIAIFVSMRGNSSYLGPMLHLA
jgi:hypothetical protein